MYSELSYLFRHALLRDAAYQLQLPGDRAHLHRFAFDLIETLAGGRPPGPVPDRDGIVADTPPHASDSWARDLASHARAGGAAAAAAVYEWRSAAVEDQIGLHGPAIEAWFRVAQGSSGAVRAEALRRAAFHLGGMERTEAAETALQEALEIARTLGLRGLEALVLADQGDALRKRELPDAARPLLERALSILKDPPRQPGLLNVMSYLAELDEAQGLHDRALSLLREALDLSFVRRDSLTEATARTALGLACMRRGLQAEAVDHLRTSLDLCLKSGRDRQVALGRMNLGIAFLNGSLNQEAGEQLNIALPALHRVGSRRAERVCLSALALFRKRLGEVDVSEAMSRQAIALCQESGDRRHEAGERANLGATLQECGRPLEAEKEYKEALEIQTSLGDLRAQGVTLVNLGNLQSSQGQKQAAQSSYELAVSRLRQARDRHHEGAALGGLASLHLFAGRFAEAAALYEQAIALHRASGNLRHLGDHLCALARSLVPVGRESDARGAWEEGSRLLRQLGEMRALEHHRSALEEACSRAEIRWFDHDR
jgi:tetratricopeptide (TPR) repeat protein